VSQREKRRRQRERRMDVRPPPRRSELDVAQTPKTLQKPSATFTDGEEEEEKDGVGASISHGSLEVIAVSFRYCPTQLLQSDLQRSMA
jgi:hypothetical protein